MQVFDFNDHICHDYLLYKTPAKRRVFVSFYI
jgi:hypothetical protein